MSQLHVTGTQQVGNHEFIEIEGGFGKDKKAMTLKDIRQFINAYLELKLSSILSIFIPKRYLNQKEVVRYTGTSAGTINDWVEQGMRIILFDEKSHPKYDIKDIDEWMEKHKTRCL